MTKLKALILLSILILYSGCVKREKVIPLNVPNNNTITQNTTHQEIVTIPQHTTSSTPVIIDNNSPFNNINNYPTEVITTIPSYTEPSYREPSYTIPRSRYLGGAYRNSSKLKKFINKMVSKYNYDRYTLNTIFSTVSRDYKALEKYNVFKKAKPSSQKTSSIGAWDKYRGNFLTSSRINKGVAFWKENLPYLNRAAQEYGVAPEYIIGIIGVETNFGGYTGKHSVMNALTTLAIEFKKRSKFFTGELESYLLMIRDEKLDPQQIKGSYAGAFGLSQFMPTAFRQHAVDFDNDGHINLFNKADAIGSIAKYFVERGKWNKRIPVAMKVKYNKRRFYGLTTGFKSNYTQRHLLSLGMRPTSNFFGYRGNVSLIKLSRYDRDELWWGTKNFYAITRYNPKDHYAMAVHQLAQAVKNAYYSRR